MEHAWNNIGLGSLHGNFVETIIFVKDNYQSLCLKKEPMICINHPLQVLLKSQKVKWRKTMAPGWNHLCSMAGKFYYDTHSNYWLLYIFYLIFRFLDTTFNTNVNINYSQYYYSHSTMPTVEYI